MAVYTKINNKDVLSLSTKFNIGKIMTYISIGLRILLSIAFVGAGGVKLAGSVITGGSKC